MATFVLVHGAWHGAWCWGRVRDRLQAEGHRVFTPTLTGLADRSHLLSPAVDLATHVDDVAGLMRWEGLERVVLCGHSYGGAVIAGAADREPGRIGAMVYLDAYVLEDGQSVQDASDPAVMAAFLELARQHGEGWRVPPPPAAAFGVNAADQAWVDDLCTAQPVATLTQPLALTGARDLGGRYIHATGWADGAAFAPYAAIARARGWAVETVDSGHDVMVDAPAELARKLAAAAP